MTIKMRNKIEYKKGDLVVWKAKGINFLKSYLIISKSNVSTEYKNYYKCLVVGKVGVVRGTTLQGVCNVNKFEEYDNNWTRVYQFEEYDNNWTRVYPK